MLVYQATNNIKNKISTHLDPLYNLIYEAYGIKDWRTITLAFGTNSRKEFLEHLKNLFN